MKKQNPNILQSEFSLKGTLIQESDSLEAFLKTVAYISKKYGALPRIIHVDNNGFYTTGYDLKTAISDNVFPVKSYLLTRTSTEPTPFKSLSNN